MMLDFKAIYKKVIYGSDIIAIEHATFNEQTSIAGITASLKKGNIQKENSFSIDSLTSINEFITKNTPVSLAVTGNNVLTKQVKANNTQEALSSAFPNLNLNEFYYEIYGAHESFFVSICRKDYISNLINDYDKSGINVITFSLGNQQLNSLLEYLDTSEIYTLTSKIKLTKAGFISIEKNQENTFKEYHFEEQTISSTHLLAFACVVNSVTNSFTVETNSSVTTEALASKFREIRFFKLTLYGGIGLLLGSLLINFFVFSTRFEKLQQLSEDKQVYKTQEKQLQKRIETIKRKEIIVKSIQKTGFSKSSFYINQIIQSLSEYITLSEFTFQPLTKNIRKGKRIEYTEDYINIKGSVNNKTALNNWINNIQLFDFVTDVTIMHYGTKKGNLADFEIAINLAINDTEK